MLYEQWLTALTASEPYTRLQAARVMGMLDETRALDTLASQYCAEKVHEVKLALSWAGQRLQRAQSAGYDTLTALFQYFHVEYEVKAAEDEAERRLMRHMQNSLDADLIRSQTNRGRDTMVGMAVGAALMGAQGMVMGAQIGMQAGADVFSSGLEPRPQIGATRVPPTRPGDSDISMAVRRLLEQPDADKRRKAAVDLGSFSNPAALPSLAQAFVQDPDGAVREAAQRSGKLIYWNALYWQMEQAGEIAAQIERLSFERQVDTLPPTADGTPSGGPQSDPPVSRTAQLAPASPIRRIQPLRPSAPAPSQPAPKSSADELAEILRKAEEMRQKRRKTRL